MVAALDLVFHDWRNLSSDERRQAVDDVRALASLGRRPRALNVMASLVHFLEEAEAKCNCDRGPQLAHEDRCASRR